MAPKEISQVVGTVTSNDVVVSIDAAKTLSKPGYYLRWSRVGKTVQTQPNNAGLMGHSSISRTKKEGSSLPSATTKTILKSVSGYAAPGQVLACMGPSGSGKTSLMNVLSGRSSFQSGCLSINGETITHASMKRLMADIAYVKQQDIFFDHLTVRDQLTYTALLRMTADSDKHTKVDRVLTMLRLHKVADSPIHMLSGGEKKRVNIGTELLTEPSVLLLDEPTSGLDSTSAVSLLKLLQKLAAQHGKTVITSIHQPSSAVFRSFDRLLMLSEGSVVYFGTPVESLDYLDRLGLMCPQGYNAADHWMDLLVLEDSDTGDAANAEDPLVTDGTPNDNGNHSQLSRALLENSWDHEAVAEEMDRSLLRTSTAKGGEHAKTCELCGTKYNTSWWTQYRVLTHRALKNSRSAIFTPLNLTKSLAIGLVSGMLYFQTSYTEKNVNDIRSYYFFTMTFWVFDAMFTSLTAFPSERTVILKERASGSYHLSAYFMAKTSSDAPVRLILPLLYMSVSFWMAGIANSASVFFGSVGCTLLSVVSGEAFGLFVGAAVYDLQKGLTVMTVITLFLMLLGGFFVENVPKFISWGKYVSPFKYAFDSSLQVVFDRDIPCDGSGALEQLCSGQTKGSAKVEDVQDFIGIQGSIGFNIGMLLLLCFIPRYIAFLCLRAKKGGDRS